MRSSIAGLVLSFAFVSAAGADDIVYVLEGEVPAGAETHFFLPFEVPEGIAEIEVRHDDLSSENILDWGLDDPNGFRGWGGGNTEPAIVGVEAASRSYVPGPLPAGVWEVVVGKAKIAERPAFYRAEITLRAEPALAPQGERTPYAEPVPLEVGARWYAGDFHVHSRESGDARPEIDEVLDFAAGRGLDFVLLSEHNTNSQLTLYGAAQAGGDVLLLPGVEFTTYAGHANGIGVTEWVDHRIGVRGATIEDAIAAMHEQGGLISINHPLLFVGDLCIGCGWDHAVDPLGIDAVEIRTGIFPGEAYWEDLLAAGSRAAAIAGSDDHRAGRDLGPIDSPIGTPTTLVWADELSVEGIVRGVRDARTVVKMNGPDDPMIETELSGRRDGDTVLSPSPTALLRAVVTGGAGGSLRALRNGEAIDEVAIDGDPFVREIEVEVAEVGEDRYRHEVIDGEGALQTLTSYVWLRAEDAAEEDDGCTVASPTPVARWPWLGALALLLLRRRRGGKTGDFARPQQRHCSGATRNRSLRAQTRLPWTGAVGSCSC